MGHGGLNIQLQHEVLQVIPLNDQYLDCNYCIEENEFSPFDDYDLYAKYRH
jgi:uncharacterized protein YneR